MAADKQTLIVINRVLTALLSLDGRRSYELLSAHSPVWAISDYVQMQYRHLKNINPEIKQIVDHVCEIHGLCLTKIQLMP